MSVRSIRRAVAAAVAACLLTTGIAFADVVQPDGDLVRPDPQGVVDLGAVAPNAVITRDVGFTLVCFGPRHVDPDQIVTVSQGTTFIPAEGGSIIVTPTTIGPVPPAWANDLAGPIGCPSALRLDANAPSTVTIVAPPLPGLNYEFTVLFSKSLSPGGTGDAQSANGPTALTFIVDVVDADTTPPVLHDVPVGLDLFTSDPAGAALDYVPPTATDDRDPAPAVACGPPPGAIAPVGPSTVNCTASDASGNNASASFPVFVHLAQVSWDEPVGEGGTLVVQGSRTVPVKLRAWLDGVPVRSGDPELMVRRCGSAPDSTPEMSLGLEFKPSNDRWTAQLPTGDLGPGCHRVALVAGGVDLAGFQLDIQDGTAARLRTLKAR